MVRIYLYLFVFGFCSVNLHAQDSLIVLHKVVGDTIGKNEKRQYLLFPEIPDSTFEYCTISQKNGIYFITSRFRNNLTSATETNASTLNGYKVNIEKLHEYYYNKAHPGASVAPENNFKAKPENHLDKKVATPALTDEQKNEIRRDARLKSDAEQMHNFKKGTEMNPGGNIELFNANTKKKKKNK